VSGDDAELVWRVVRRGWMPLTVTVIAAVWMHVSPVTYWGGDLCVSPSSPVATCGVPPLGLSVTALLLVLTVQSAVGE